FCVLVKFCLLCLLIFVGGCDPADQRNDNVDPEALSAYSEYTAVKIDILPLTGFVLTGEQEESVKLRIYVSLLDSFGCQIKSPAIFRFELYEHKDLSAERKGRRVMFWPDINLNNSSENNNYWKDYLRTYEFNFDFEPGKNQDYTLLVTSICPDGRRLSAEYYVKRIL
ncbi:MAG: hypothetical protein ACYTBV_18580, partial [Planctomycetota bacterium]